ADRRAFRYSLIDAALNLLHGVRRNQRPHDCLRVTRIAAFQGLCPGDELFKELIVNSALDDDLACIGADLPLMKEGAKRGGSDSIIHVDIVQDNERIVAAELKNCALERAPGAFGQ